MSNEDIKIAISKKFRLNIEDIKEESRFLEDLNLDSIDLLETLMEIEEEYSIHIPDEKMIDIKTVGEFSKVVLEVKNG